MTSLVYDELTILLHFSKDSSDSILMFCACLFTQEMSDMNFEEV